MELVSVPGKQTGALDRSTNFKWLIAPLVPHFQQLKQ